MREYAATVKFAMTKSKLAQLDGITSLVRLHGTPYLLAESSSTSSDTNTNPSSPSVATKSNDYWPRRITEEFGVDSGWTVEIEMVNHVLPQGAV
jgi:hypothetical protein